MMVDAKIAAATGEESVSRSTSRRDGREARLRPLTLGPEAHFFGYFNLCPWNISGERMAVHRTTSKSALPARDDEAEILVMEDDDFASRHVLSRTTAWNWQQGSLMQWSPVDEHLLFHNARGTRPGSFVARRIDTRTGDGDELERPIYSIDPRGHRAYSVDFARLHVARPGYGYTMDVDRGSLKDCPVDDGLWTVDLETGEPELFVPLRRLLWTSPLSSMADAFHWIDHVQVSRRGSWVSFLHRWLSDDGGFFSRLMVADEHADRLYPLFSGGSASHYDWADDRSLIGWFRPERTINKLRMTSRGFRQLLRPVLRVAHRHRNLFGKATATIAGDHYFRVDAATGKQEIVGEGLLTEDCHCAISPDGDRMLVDSYPDDQRNQHLGIFDLRRGTLRRLGSFHSPPAFTGGFRCDLHARWSREGDRICFDATMDGSRQVYLYHLA